MKISVIVTTKNEESNIENCLKSIKEQTYPQEKMETIVVDNNSTDKTREIALKYTEKVYNFGSERSAQRNFGIKQASGEYILYLDADMILSRGVIQECVDKCENKGPVALYIPERIIGKGFWIRVRDFERSFYNATCIDAVRFARKDKVLEIGGFDEDLAGPEDWDFDRRIKEVQRVDIIDSPIYHNEGDFNINKYLGKKSYYSRYFDKYIQKWGRDDLTIKRQLGFSYRYLGVFTENGKWKKLLRNPVLTMGMYKLKVTIGMIYLLRKIKR
jgi:glycosyltransferase involved in cell wall biosynthesis